MKARLAVFSVDSINDENMYLCTDFLTGEQYALNLPIEEEFDTRDMLFVGHCFYNNTMVMNYVRCLKMGRLARKRLYEMLKHCYDWYRIQEPEAKWTDFIERHPMLLRHLTYIYSVYVKLDGFGHETHIKNYNPPDITENDEKSNEYTELFSGWLLAKSSLTSLSHPIYDITLNECTNTKKS